MSKKFRKGIASKVTVTFLSLSTALFVSGASMAVPLVAHAQSSDLSTFVELLISLGIIPADKAVAARAAVGGSSGTTEGGACGFTRDLTMSSTGNDVKCLQQYLNGAGFQVSVSGAGSPGNESTYFGAKTKSAVAAWQAANGVAPVAGYFGARSRARYVALTAGGPMPTPTPTPTGIPSVGTGLRVDPGTQPANSLAPENAARVPFTRVRLTAANDGDVTVNSITVERTGLLSDSALSGIVVIDQDGTQISNVAKTLNANHQAVLNDAFVIPRGTSKEVTIAANMPASNDARAGEVGYLSVIGVDAGGATVSGSLPIVGAGHTINATLSIGSVSVDTGALDPRTNVTKEVGTTGYVFSAVKFTAGSGEDVIIEQVRWNQSGSVASSDLKNLKMTDSKGGSYDVVVSSDGKYSTGKIAGGLTVLKGDSIEFNMKGDVDSGSGRTVDFDLFRRTDVVARGATFGYYITPANGTDTSGTDDSAFHQDTNPWYDASQIEVGTGSLRVEKSNSVSAGNVTAGGTNQALGAFTIEAKGEPMTFTSFVLNIATTDSDAGGEVAELTNVTVYNASGAAVMGPKDFTKTSITFTDSVTVPTGAQVYTVRGKLGSTGWENNDTIAVSLQTPATKITSITGQTTGRSITATPASNVTANTQTVKASALTVTPSSALFAQNVIIGANAVELGRFNLDASNSGDDLRITSIQVLAYTSSTMDVDDLNTLQIFDGETALTTGSNINNPSGNTAGGDIELTFTLDSSLIVTKGTNKILKLKANASTGLTADETIAFDFSDGGQDWAVTGVTTGATVTETLNTTAGSTLTFKSGGGYEITEDTSAGQSQTWYPSGTQGVTIGAFRFKTTTEAMAIKAFQLQLSNTASSTASDITALYVYDGSKLIAKKVPQFNSNVENFTFNTSAAEGDGSASSPTNFLEIPADNFKIITVKADLVGISTVAGTSGRLIAINTGPGSNVQQKAVGRGSGTEVSPAVWASSGTAGTTTVAGVRYFRAVPKVEIESLPAGTSLVSGGVIYKFKVTAQGGDVGIYKMTFKMSTSGGAGMQVDQIVLRDDTLAQDLTNAITVIGTTTVTQCVDTHPIGGCNFDTSGNARLNIVPDNTSFGQTWVRIPEGTSHTFSLRANTVALSGTTGEKVTTQLLTDAAVPVGTTTVAWGKKLTFKIAAIEPDVNDDFIWTDFLAEATSTGTTINTNDWFNGYRVNGLETDLNSVTVTE